MISKGFSESENDLTATVAACMSVRPSRRRHQVRTLEHSIADRVEGRLDCQSTGLPLLGDTKKTLGDRPTDGRTVKLHPQIIM